MIPVIPELLVLLGLAEILMGLTVLPYFALTSLDPHMSPWVGRALIVLLAVNLFLLVYNNTHPRLDFFEAMLGIARRCMTGCGPLSLGAAVIVFPVAAAAMVVNAWIGLFKGRAWSREVFMRAMVATCGGYVKIRSLEAPPPAAVALPPPPPPPPPPPTQGDG